MHVLRISFQAQKGRLWSEKENVLGDVQGRLARNEGGAKGGMMSEDLKTNMLLDAGQAMAILWRYNPQEWTELAAEMAKQPDFLYKNHLNLFALARRELKLRGEKS